MTRTLNIVRVSDILATVPDPRISVRDDAIVINVTHPYAIPFNECRTDAEILRWAAQLSEKTWMTRALLNRFLRLAMWHPQRFKQGATPCDRPAP